MGISMLRGRAITAQDGGDAPRVVVINEAMKRRFWPNEDPLGKRISFLTTDGTPDWREIVGVVKDIRHTALDSEPQPEMYFPFSQFPLPFMTIVVRTASDPLSLVPAARNQVMAVDKDQPISNIHTMEELLAISVSQRRFNMLLLITFAVVALALASVGIYGVMSYTVAERTHEIGLRMALGAQRRDVIRLVISQGMMLAGIGVGIGLVCAFAMTRMMSSLLFGVGATDPLTYALIAALLSSVALLACYLPARRATKVDPMVALRYE
jgi:putative ABC transport system permease protein